MFMGLPGLSHGLEGISSPLGSWGSHCPQCISEGSKARELKWPVRVVSAIRVKAGNGVQLWVNLPAFAVGQDGCGWLRDTGTAFE